MFAESGLQVDNQSLEVVGDYQHFLGWLEATFRFVQVGYRGQHHTERRRADQYQ